ncbi:MAG: enoyl-CoA hydratase [Acidimicrobiia bacterium]|nr:enoyl-CoA hydratase [Acidimicrobiia bacterium]
METLQVERYNGVVTITLDRPKVKNAMNRRCWEELLDELAAIAVDPDDRAVVITGAGADFCSGADLSDGGPFAGARHMAFAMQWINQVPLALHRLPKPTIAKVRGVAAGAGANLALGCDLIVASENARFAEIFAKRGLSIDFGGSWALPRLIGLHRAKELAFFGDVVSAADADRLGLVNRVVPDAELDDFVTGWAERLARGAPVALAQTKRLLNESIQRSMAEALDAEGAGQMIAVGTKDAKEAVKAFLAKREPSFEGR